MNRAVFTILASAVVPTITHAQAPAVGFKLGTISSTVTGTNISYSDSRTALTFGASLVYFIGTGAALQTELLVVNKGGSSNQAGFSSTVRARYVEVPALVRLSYDNGSKRFDPHLLVGPAIGILLTCTMESRACDSGGDVRIEVNKIDLSLLIGGGLSYIADIATVIADIRFTQGTRDLWVRTDSKHRTFSLSAGVSLPLRALD